MHCKIYPRNKECTSWGWMLETSHSKKKECMTLSSTMDFTSSKEAKDFAEEWLVEMGLDAEIRVIEEYDRYKPLVPFKDVRTYYCTCHQVGCRVTHYPEDDFEEALTVIELVVSRPTGTSFWKRIRQGFKYIFKGRMDPDHDEVQLTGEQVKNLIEFLKQSYALEER